jgi:hypothetical protein
MKIPQRNKRKFLASVLSFLVLTLYINCSVWNQHKSTAAYACLASIQRDLHSLSSSEIEKIVSLEKEWKTLTEPDVDKLFSMISPTQSLDCRGTKAGEPLLDNWNSRIQVTARFSAIHKPEFKVWSKGADRISDTPDDVVSLIQSPEIPKIAESPLPPKENPELLSSTPNHSFLLKLQNKWPTDITTFEVLVLDRRRNNRIEKKWRLFHENEVVASTKITNPKTQKYLFNKLDFRTYWDQGIPKSASVSAYGIRIVTKKNGLDLVFYPGIPTVDCYDYDPTKKNPNFEGYDVYLHSYDDLEFLTTVLRKRNVVPLHQ